VIPPLQLLLQDGGDTDIFIASPTTDSYMTMRIEFSFYNNWNAFRFTLEGQPVATLEQGQDPECNDDEGTYKMK